MRDAFLEVPSVKEDQIGRIIEKIDKDGSGDIDLDELVETCMFDSTVENSQMLMDLINHFAKKVKTED